MGKQLRSIFYRTKLKISDNRISSKSQGQRGQSGREKRKRKEGRGGPFVGVLICHKMKYLIQSCIFHGLCAVQLHDSLGFNNGKVLDTNKI